MTVDNVVRMREWLAAHPGAEWIRPEGTLQGKHAVRYTLPDGTELSPAHDELGMLVDFLEAVDRAQLPAN